MGQYVERKERAGEKVIERFGEGLLQQTRRRPFGLMRRGRVKERMSVNCPQSNNKKSGSKGERELEEKRKTMDWTQEKATTTDLLWSLLLTAPDPPNPQSEHSHRIDGCRKPLCRQRQQLRIPPR